MCGIINSKMNYFERARYFRTKKRLGQNFLVDGEVIRDIIEYANIQPEDTILEIGPGVGFVTEQLVKYAQKVIAVELDEEAIKELKPLKKLISAHALIRISTLKGSRLQTCLFLTCRLFLSEKYCLTLKHFLILNFTK